MSLTTRVLLGLLGGLVVGFLVGTVAPPEWRMVVTWIEPVGTIWTRLLQMTVVPLVVSLLFAGVLTGGAGIGRLGARAVGLFVALLGLVATATLLVAPGVFALVPIETAAAEALRSAGGGGPAAVPGFREWLVGLVPSNLVAAASTGAMLPVILATLLFAAAATTLAADTRAALARAAAAVSEMTLVVVRWILAAAPVGVFALAVPLAARLGVAALGAVAAYIIITVAMSVAVILALYPVVAVRGTPLRQFARALLPAQGIAVSARSSLAALPALIEGARALGLPPAIQGFFLPFSTSLFRLGAAVALPAGVLFIARIYGVMLSPADLATVGVTSVLLSLSVPGIPGGSILIMAPVLLAVGLPVEGIGILLAVDTIPDMFRTTANVTGTMAAAALLRQPAPGMKHAPPPVS